jgi:glutamate 5-kinase
MRILIALGESPSHGGAPASALALIAADHEVLVTHASEPAAGQELELGLRNALPDRDVVSVLTQVVVGVGDAADKPQAIAEIRSLRVLLDFGAVVVCAGNGSLPVTLDRYGSMHRVEGPVDGDLTAALLARRLDADLLLILTEAQTASQVEAASRFAEATGRRAAIGSLAEATRMVRGEAGTQLVAPLA